MFGYINMTRAFYALMKARGKGVIINILGNGGERVDAGYICGAAGNASLMAFTRAIGGASAKDGIRVVGVNPGPVATERLVKLMQKESVDRYGTPDRWQDWTGNFRSSALRHLRKSPLWSLCSPRIGPPTLREPW